MDDGYDGLDAIAVSKDCYEELEGSTSSKTVDSDSTGYEDASTRNPMFYSALDAERQRYERAFEVRKARKKRRKIFFHLFLVSRRKDETRYTRILQCQILIALLVLPWFQGTPTR